MSLFNSEDLNKYDNFSLHVLPTHLRFKEYIYCTLFIEKLFIFMKGKDFLIGRALSETMELDRKLLYNPR